MGKPASRYRFEGTGGAVHVHTVLRERSGSRSCCGVPKQERPCLHVELVSFDQNEGKGSLARHFQRAEYV